MILLIDDDTATNFLHRRTIRKFDTTIEIREALDGAIAIAQLEQALMQGEDPPTFIFLDINMPNLNGWEFLEAYTKLPENWRSRAILFMLTTSLNPDDHERAMGYPEVTELIDKMLTAEKLERLLRKYGYK